MNFLNKIRKKYFTEFIHKNTNLNLVSDAYSSSSTKRDFYGTNTVR